MNPFLTSVLARPLAERSPEARSGVSASSPPPVPASASPTVAASPTRPCRPRRAALTRRLAGILLALATWSIGAPAAAVDLNSANAEALQAVRGIGAKTAELIVRERERGGPFESFADLSDRVRGIGPKRAQSLQSAGLSLGATALARPEAGVAPSARGGGSPAPARR